MVLEEAKAKSLKPMTESKVTNWEYCVVISTYHTGTDVRSTVALCEPGTHYGLEAH